ncbi:ATP-dependent zinc protease [Aeromonas schubertii]|uniref:ATP-dependent zinc protease n=2 Tax=Aeromonas schubertii TaxID=652 RepID=A0ABS7VBI6_9GAMM|nr:ATP-dependent zinc protease [Aeromonas schubertii]MBZ6066348.1 ATP-dependent zinc protease [Aeromonas schubertii]
MKHMNSTIKGMTLLSLFTLGGCVAMEKAPQTPPATLAEIKSELSLSEQRLQSNLMQQQKQLIQQQSDLIAQLTSDLKRMKQTVSKVDDKLDNLPGTEPKPVVIPTTKCPAPAQGHTLDGKLLVGEAEWLWVDAANDAFQARVDTGATTSSISAQDITIFERNGKNWVRFYLSHQEMDDRIQIEAPLVRHVRVRQASADELDRRPVVRLAVRLGDMTEKAEFTLKDRSDMAFPVLLGREYLKDIAVVDVAREYIQPKPQLKDVK